MCNPVRIVSLFMVIAVVWYLPVYALEIDADCIEPADHDYVTFFLIDRSDKLEDTQGLKQSLVAIRKMIRSGERLIAGVSTDKLSDARIVIDVVKPKKTVWVSSLKIRAQEKKFETCFAQMEKYAMHQEESHPNSAILETLSFVSKALSSDKAKNKRVIVYSDMVQNSKSLSFYRGKSVNPEAALVAAEKEYLMWDFKDVEFHVAGVGKGIDAKKARAIEQFWKLYIDKSGGSLVYYGPILLVG